MKRMYHLNHLNQKTKNLIKTILRYLLDISCRESSLAHDFRSFSKVGLLFKLFKEPMATSACAMLIGTSIPETALSAELLKFLHSLSISLHPCPSSCMLSTSLTSLILLGAAGSVPSLPAPESNPSLSRASSNPVLFNAVLSGVICVICSITFVTFTDCPVVVASDNVLVCNSDDIVLSGMDVSTVDDDGDSGISAVCFVFSITFV